MTSLVTLGLLDAGQRAAPFFTAALLMGLGYFRFLPSFQHQHNYHEFAFATLSYSDVIWLYLRDNLATRPMPYVDYPLEYPVLLGVFSYLVSWVPGVVSYFTVTYLIMAAAGLGTIWAIGQLGGADVWRFALVPTLYFYTGLNWDLAAVLLATLALLAFRRDRDLSGALLLTAAVWFKLFPVVLLPAVLYERYRAGRLGDALRIGAVFAAGSVAVNLPFAVANWHNWLLFFTFNRERPADAGLWAAFGQVPIAQANALISAGLLAGAVLLGLFVLKFRTPAWPVALLLLVWWLLLNKVFSPQYALYVYWAAALLRMPWPLWTALVAADIGHYLASFTLLNIASNGPGDAGQIIAWQEVYVRAPYEIVREVLFLAFIAYGLFVLARRRRVSPL